MTYYKATRADGKDFHTGTIDYAAALRDGTVLIHTPHAHTTARLKYAAVKYGDNEALIRKSDAGFYFSIATTPTDCTGMEYPHRLFEVEPVDEPWVPNPTDLPNKRACRRLRVLREIDASQALGPQHQQIKDFWAQTRALTLRENRALADAYGKVFMNDSYGGASDRMHRQVRKSGRNAAADLAASEAENHVRGSWGLVGHVARALTVRDLLDPEDYRRITQPWREVMGFTLPD
jgi:hypothetical protein